MKKERMLITPTPAPNIHRQSPFTAFSISSLSMHPHLFIASPTPSKSIFARNTSLRSSRVTREHINHVVVCVWGGW